MERLTAEELADYLIEIGGTLVSYGCPSYRLEELVRVVAEVEGLQAQAFAMPTGLFVTVGETAMTPLPGKTKPDAPVVRMVRVKEWGISLDRLAAVDEIFNDVIARRATVREARKRLRDLDRTSATYPDELKWLAAAIVSASAAVFFRGGTADIVVSAVAGLCVFGLARAMSKNSSGRFLVDFGGGLIAAAIAWGATRLHRDVSREVIVLSGVISLIPGMTLTTGLAELAQKNLVSGGGRLMDAFVTFLSILFGIALAIGIEHMVGGTDAVFKPARHGLPLPWQAASLVASAVAFAVIFSVPRRYVWAAVASGGIGYIATFFGTRYLPAHVAAFVAALAVCLYSNVAARATDRPAQLFQLPGMMLLVPGSFGFLSLELFLRGDYLAGAAQGFTMLITAGALVTGVLVANVVLPARKVL
jgi:uncharacterized membrane protein YjjP (DUF1212 family)